MQTTTIHQAKLEVQRATLLCVVVAECATVLQLLACENQTLLVCIFAEAPDLFCAVSICYERKNATCCLQADLLYYK